MCTCLQEVNQTVHAGVGVAFYQDGLVAEIGGGESDECAFHVGIAACAFRQDVAEGRNLFPDTDEAGDVARLAKPCECRIGFVGIVGCLVKVGEDERE